MYSEKFNSNVLSITIAPTLDCNFRCIYCYEKEVINKTRMTKETADCIIDVIRERSKSLELLDITWYGGEPLLEIDMIEYLSNEIIKICDSNDIRYVSRIVTNGYYLNEKNVQILKKSKVPGIQVTIDGTGLIHNRRRPLFDGSPTFDTIINNFNITKKNNCIVHLRINIDKENEKDIFEIVDMLGKMDLKKWVIPYLAIIRNHDNCYTDDKCVSDDCFFNIKEKFNTYIRNKGFTRHDINAQLPHRVNSICSADRANDLIIGPDGELYQCWLDIGDYNLSVGNIRDGIFKNQIYLEYVMSDPTVDVECKECKYLPICLSGCPAERTDKNKLTCLESKASLKGALYPMVEDYSMGI